MLRDEPLTGWWLVLGALLLVALFAMPYLALFGGNNVVMP
jgi:hypothetical protein